ncbi:LysR family transcriptional regulator [Pelotomaculum propionicicum]|uniref:HTH-type transcriptional regulator CysL n=1 Tax=Pelotomaculum propionicicum TaxID=258475 RepID=A0A4Y7RNJ2_9FIRM|nr:LysR family transcriptional regulator [Pelotomaculum propionicicum]TEB10320.1 HTH-type transcriptional regulator CysL [Pelotomaculum propionicicum]
MRLEQLYYLTEVAKTKSISLTAEQIYVSQPSISEAIHKLEKELGVTLLTRSTQGVCLTEDGEEVVKKSREILKLVEDLKLGFKACEPKTPTLRGNLRISSSPVICAGILQKVLITFSRNYPDVNITVKEKLPEKVILDVNTGKADLGLIVIPDGFSTSCEWAEIYFERLFYDKLVIGAGKSSPLSKRKSISLKQLLKYPVAIHQGEDINENWHVKLLKKYGEPKKILKLENPKLFYKVIIEGIAIGFFSKSFLKNFYLLEDIISIPISNTIQLSYGWVRSNTHPFLATAQEFVKVLKSSY